MRGRDVFVVQSTSRPVNEAIIGLILTITAIRRAGANKITAVIPYYGYSRAVGGAPTSLDSQTAQLVVASNQAHLAPGMILDEEEDAIEDAPLSVFGSQGTVAARPISAADVATLLEEAGVDMVITVDLQPPGRGQIEVSNGRRGQRLSPRFPRVAQLLPLLSLPNCRPLLRDPPTAYASRAALTHPRRASSGP